MENFIELLKTFFNLQASIGKKYVEIRFIKTKQGIVSGIFETTEQGAEAIANEVKRLGLERCSMYHTINILSDEYVNNFTIQYKMNTLYPNMKKTTSDADIGRIILIMLDFDPKRASGISSTDDEKAKAKECMDSLITFLTSENFPAPVYITDSGNGYNAYLMVDFSNESEECKKAFSKIALSKSILLSSNAMNTVYANMVALFDEYADTAPIGTRIIHKKNDYYYAVASDKVIHICNGKAEIVSECPVYFAYDPQFVPQITPDLTSPATALSGLVDELFSISPQNKLRFLAQLCGFFMPNLPTPILVLSGGHGTAKTTTARKLVKLVDPKFIDVISIPDKEDGLTAILSGNYIAVLDNIDTISPKFSDILCIACTGGYTAKRKLYTDNAVVSAPLKTHIILNGIGDFISRPDLAERSNIIYLDPITTRMTEKQVWQKFNKLKPQLLGSIFNTIAKGLTLIDDMENKVTDLPRMADFAQYGAAFIKAMGLNPDDFIKEYSKSNTQFIADCSSSDPFIVAINNLVESNGGTWTGTSTQLLEQLKATHAVSVNYTPSTLSRKLNQCSTDLKATGISVNIKATTPKSITLSCDSNAIVF